MIKTMIIGNVLYAAAMVGLWMAVSGDRSRFMPAFIIGTITFFAGIATGIIGSQPKKKSNNEQSRRRRAATAARALESITD